ncbi:sulfotransferase [Paracoccus simplex]|uniref:Sulfotransferase n=1 Tax=Paracoccus simplex TaxID=2086346 RepID=A0ABV7S4G4_9RHOB
MPTYRHLFAPRDGYVFVVTYGRSGSTLTQSLLNAIPGYAIRGENANLTHLFAKAIHLVREHEMFRWRREDLGKPRAERRPYLQPILGKPWDPWAGAEKVNPDQFSLALMDLFVRQMLRPPKDCRVCGFKEIRFHEDPSFFRHHLDIMRAAFPKTRFLFQRRNHEAVARSSWWAKQPREQVFSQLRLAERLFADYIAEHPDCTMMLDYERLVSDPEHIRAMHDFLGEPMDPAAVKAVLARSLKH